MAKTIFNITGKDLSPEELEALQEKARDFLGVPEKDGVEETQKQVVQEVEEKLEKGDFGIPDEKQQKILDKMPEELKEKLKGKLFFREDTTEIIINSGKLVFDKIQKFTEPSDWETAMENAKSIGQRLLSKEESEELFDLFEIGEKYYGDELRNILNVTGYIYWSSTAYVGYPNYAWYGNFYHGNMGYVDKNDTTNYTLCVHN